MLKKFAAYYRPQRKLFILDMTASMLVALIGILYPVITRTMLNDLIPNRQYTSIILYGSGLLVIYVIRLLLQYFIQYQGHMMGVEIQAAMRRDMFSHLEKLSYSYYNTHETGKIMSRMTNDLMDISELAHHGPENLLISSITIIISFIYLLNINVWLTLIIFIVVPVMGVIAGSLQKKMRDAFKRSRQAIASINASLESSISGIRVTKAFTNSEKEMEKFEISNKEFIEARRDSYQAMAKFHSSTTFITDVFNVIVLIGGGLFLYAGKITFGDYSAFIVSVNLFINPVMTLINFMESYQNGVTGFERFLEIMAEEPEKDKEGAKDCGTLSGDIRFDHVNYAYADDVDTIVLDDVSLHIEKGQKYALVGPSGGGKSTFCHLLPRFFNVSSGRILLDGQDVNDLTMDSIRRNIGIVQQDVFLFNASVRDNILYGRLDATEEEVIAAAKKANIHDYIMEMPNGYDTIVGERGVRLSGGQKQRLSIARVFLKDPAILVLDEATSALDNTTELLIQEALDELCKGRTTVVVAHRLSTIKSADRIAVISKGCVTEEGTHAELLAKNGMYAELYNLQFKLTN